MIHSTERGHPNPGEVRARPTRLFRDLAIALVTFAVAFAMTSTAKSWHSRQNFPGGISVSGAATLSGATTLSGAVTQSGAVTHTAAYTHSGSGTGTISTSGAYTITSGDWTFSGADTDVNLTGVTSDLAISGGGDFTLSGDGVFTQSGTGVRTISTSGDTTYSGGDLLLDGPGTDINITNTGAYKMDGDIALKCVTKSLTNGEVLALNATPIELVAAPGANKILVPYSIIAVHNYAVAAFGDDAGEDLSFKYTNSSGVELFPRVDSDGFADQTNDEVRTLYATDTALAGAVSAGVVPASNAAIVVHLLVGEWITGEGILEFRICYSVQPDLL